MSWTIEKRKQGNEIWVSTSTGLNELAKVIVKALNEYEQTGVEQEGWVCKHCGKSTFETEYDYLADIDEHLGCALKKEI